MIAKLTGVVDDTFSSCSTITVGGVGYAVYTTDLWKAQNPQNTTVTVYIYTHVKEDALELYGFQFPQERKLFELLISVSGVGPRTALLILNAGVIPIESAISQADVSFFTAIPRIGKKNAQKIIIELKNKIGSVNELDLKDTEGTMEHDIVEALTSMGFSSQEVTKIVRANIDAQATIEVNIKNILKKFSKK